MNPWRGLKGIPHNVWILAFATLINRSGTMVLPFLALYMIKVIGLSQGSAGLVLTFYGLGAFVTAPFVGKLADKLGALRVMKLSLAISGLMLFAYSIITNLYLILFTTVMWSVVSESFRPANLSMISKEAGAERLKTSFALNRLAVNLGMSIGPVIGGFLSTINFHLLFYVDGITSILAALFLVFSKIESKNEKTEEKEPHPGDMEIKQSNEHEHKVNIFKDKRFLVFVVSIMPVTIVFFQLFGAVPVFLVQHLGYKESVFGMMMAINTGLIIFLEVPLNNVIANWDDRLGIALGALLCGIGFGAMALFHSLVPIIITVIIWTFGEMMFFPSSTSYATRISPENKRGEYMGYYQMTFSFSVMVGPWLGTETLENFGHVFLWTAAFVFCTATVLIFSKLRKNPSFSY